MIEFVILPHCSLHSYLQKLILCDLPCDLHYHSLIWVQFILKFKAKFGQIMLPGLYWSAIAFDLSNLIMGAIKVSIANIMSAHYVMTDIKGSMFNVWWTVLVSEFPLYQNHWTSPAKKRRVAKGGKEFKTSNRPGNNTYWNKEQQQIRQLKNNVCVALHIWVCERRKCEDRFRKVPSVPSPKMHRGQCWFTDRY